VLVVRALRRWVQIALKPASKGLGLHGVFIGSKGLKDLITDSASKRMQVDVPGASWLDADEHHRGLTLRTSGALNCSEWNDGRDGGMRASLELAGAQHSLSPMEAKGRAVMLYGALLHSGTPVNSTDCGAVLGTRRGEPGP
jgi:hypothetical protein